jgi:ankyrin repeat protein
MMYLFTQLGQTPLNIAAIHGSVNIAEALINARANIGNADEKGFTPLHLASMEGHTEFVELLLSEGANYSQRDSKGYLAVHWSIMKDQLNVYNVFLEKTDFVPISSKYMVLTSQAR